MQSAKPAAPDTTRTATGLLIAGLAYYGLAAFGMRLVALAPGNITLLWLPSGVALLMCLHWGLRALPVIAVASFLANVPGMASGPGLAPYLHTSVAAGADALSGLLTSTILRRLLPGGLARTSDVLTFVLMVCILPTLATSAVLTANLALGHYVTWQETPYLFRMLLLADSLGILLVYPIYQGWRDSRDMATQPGEWTWIWRIALLLGLMLLLDASWLAGIVYFVLPLLLLLAFNVRLFGVAMVTTLVLIVIIVATVNHLGTLVRPDPIDTHFRLMAFAFSTAITVLGMSLHNTELLATRKTSRHWSDIAERDPLTNLFNRRGLLARLQLEHHRAERYRDQPYVFAMLDVDHFKSINDRFGHAVGDTVLQRIAQCLAATCRDIDTPARWGGEEFALLMPGTSVEDARQPLERIRAAIAALPIMDNGVAVRLTVSIGVAAVSSDPDADALAIIEHADRALYCAKRDGRDRLIVDIA